MTERLDFQSMIMALEKFWADQGCLIWQPYYSQVGAGTMNPATYLRVLGPEPFNVAYVEPSVRPDDGRYGDNPNRLQTFYQYQVILKPDPGNPQEIYLESLKAIGIDPSKHDIRFVEDNWEQPALGAWGLGWEVWLDGLEITQFTYFQQSGGVQLDPVSVEITYGLDRIAAPLQDTYGFQNIQWNQDRTFGDMNFMAEREHSSYYFEVANVGRMRKAYGLFEEEVNSALEHELVLPAYDNLLKLSHLFNIMDTRGAIGVTERQAFFRKMRRLAGKVSEAYVEQRQQMEYPWLDVTASAAEKDKTQDAKQTKLTALDAPADFLLEIGTEEIPSSELDTALEQLTARVPELLKDLRLEHGEVKIMGTPRRLVVYVKDLAPSQPDREELAKGPPAQRAFDSDGKPTKAAEGFARGKGIAVGDLEVQEIDGGKYVVAKVFEKGRSSIEVLAEALPDLISNIRFEKSMRWNSSNVAFSRPIRSLLALHGEQVIPFDYAGYTADNSTRGLHYEQEKVTDAAAYFATLKEHGILLDPSERKAAIQQQAGKLAADLGGSIPDDADLLNEVSNLVEAPMAIVGSIDEAHLALPREALIAVMKKHQRYFPVEKDGQLLPYFITIANGDYEEPELIAKGNEGVVRARFEDAAFFIKEDQKRSLADFVADLDGLTFQKDLGSMLDKTKRIEQLADQLSDPLGLDAKEKETALRAAHLCKADLVTSMVVEMTSLQGVIGNYYALDSGESEEVGQAIHEHYLPRFAGDAAPRNKAGLVVGLADRLDSLAGLFAAGLAPTGNKDPFGLRRAAISIVQNLIDWDIQFDLRTSLDETAKLLPIEANKESQQESYEFILGRARNLFLEQGHRYDIVDSVLAEQGHNPASAVKAIEQLCQWVERDDWDTTLDSYARCVRITRDLGETYTVDVAAFTEEASKQLYAALEKAESTERSPGSVDDFLNAFTPMIPAVTAFFDNVLVMAEDKKVKQNRLGLLQRIATLAHDVADLSHLEGF
ncbi:MAG: glycine--tRNA ligase subunit beta [Chloroflexi bacterium]|nr:MAG: glycine--tRNA ligase subunit beta [Chloroflexota bacterium]MBL1194426.1 glycine--tRNA ligase subunit beta [Chloroflexota bacterium]NOH11714.1 glycine--tRNA ligase subunit beta [Chloroflexota bacterium]